MSTLSVSGGGSGGATSGESRPKNAKYIEEHIWLPADEKKFAGGEQKIKDILKVKADEFRAQLYWGSTTGFICQALHALIRAWGRKHKQRPIILIDESEPLAIWEAARWHSDQLGGEVRPFKSEEQLNITNVAALVLSDENINLQSVSDVCFSRGICHICSITSAVEMKRAPLPGHIAVADLHRAVDSIPGVCLALISLLVEGGLEMPPYWSGDPSLMNNQAFMIVVRHINDWAPDIKAAVERFNEFGKLLKNNNIRLVSGETFRKDPKAYPEGMIILSPIPAPFINFIYRKKGNNIFHLEDEGGNITRHPVKEDIYRINLLRVDIKICLSKLIKAVG